MQAGFRPCRVPMRCAVDLVYDAAWGQSAMFSLAAHSHAILARVPAYVTAIPKGGAVIDGGKQDPTQALKTYDVRAPCAPARHRALHRIR